MVFNKRLPSYFFLIIICFVALYCRAGVGEDDPLMVPSPVIDEMANMVRELEQELENVLKVRAKHLDMAVAAEQEKVQHWEDIMANIMRLTKEVNKMKATNLVLEKENADLRNLKAEIELERKVDLINSQEAEIVGNKHKQKAHEFGLRIRRRLD